MIPTGLISLLEADSSILDVNANNDELEAIVDNLSRHAQPVPHKNHKLYLAGGICS